MGSKTTGNKSEEKVTVLIGDASFHYHPNGGGLVADTASVAETVHVAPRAMVFGEAQLSDRVQVTGRARVGGTVKASEGVVFGGSVFITEGTFKGFNKIIHQK